MTSPPLLLGSMVRKGLFGITVLFASDGVGQMVYTQDQKAWALSACGLTTEVNHGSHGILGERIVTPTIRRQAVVALERWWGIHDKKELLATLEHLENSGHHKEFEELRAMSADARTEYRQTNVDNPQKLNRAWIAEKYADNPVHTSLLGWDYSRYIHLCGTAYVAGLFSQVEAWGFILPIATKLQAAFHSWDEMGENYLIGRRFWASSMADGTIEEYVSAFENLKNAPDSPWKLCEWSLCLAPVAMKKP